MATIYTREITSAQNLRNEFADCNRDHYSMETYEGILQFIDDTTEEGAAYQLDVIAWCCDLNEESFEDLYDSYNDIAEKVDEYQEENELDEIDFDEEEVKEIIRDYISDHTCVIAEGDDFLAFLAF